MKDNNKMLETFQQKISLEKFLTDGKNFEIQMRSDFISYPEFLKYFRDLETLTRHNLIIGINFTYGWMPTIFDFRSKNFNEALVILNKAKKDIIPTVEDLTLLKGLFNNSLVGTSKVLHFINPNVFAIWDSRVYRYLTGKESHDYRIGNSNTYLDYLEFCDYLTKQKEFNMIYKSVIKKVGYSMTPFRVVELIMYSNGARQ